MEIVLRKIIPVPAEISDRQFGEVLAFDGIITREECLAWTGAGVIPAQLKAAVDLISDDDIRFSALNHLGGETRFLRANGFVAMLGYILGYSSDALDDLWRRAKEL